MHIITWITGILTVLLGIYAVVRPMRTFLSIGWILGILLTVNGIELVILALSKEKKEIGALSIMMMLIRAVRSLKIVRTMEKLIIIPLRERVVSEIQAVSPV